MLHHLLYKHTKMSKDGVGVITCCEPRFRGEGARFGFRPDGWDGALMLITPEQAKALIGCTTAAEAIAVLNANTY